MDVSHPVEEHCQEQNSLDTKDKHTGAEETMQVGSDSIDTDRPKPSPEDSVDFEANLRSDGTPQAATNNSGTPSQIEKRVNSKLGGKRYPLRSSLEGTRVLRSRSNGVCNAPPTNTSTNSISSTAQRRKNRKKRTGQNKVSNDELADIRRRVKYLSARMNYEQSLIDAYSGEGWKGQSAEKVRPEKELQRASSEILRRKLELRDLFQRLDSICAEGKLQDSLFDSEGQIDNEDIFCAKCGSKDFSANNDIVLCDGGCDRGFHQMCLVPPLLNIPPGDDSWLCPGCDCKVDCIGVLNDIQGTNLSIEDKWEEVFPEAAAAASGDKQQDELGLPSDDSEDDDYDPDCPEADEKIQKESSSSEESGSTSTSDGSSASADDKQHINPGFSSDDSEDNDFDPDAPELDEKVQSEGSSSDESDFSSDTNDLIPSKYDNDSSGSDNESSPNHAEHIGGFDGGEPEASQRTKRTLSSELLSTLERDQSGEIFLPVSGKRLRERLDYKKLNDETYGNIRSDSSDDDDWTDMNLKKVKRRGESKSTVMASLQNTQTIQDGENTKQSQRKPEGEVLPKQEKLPDTRTLHNLESEGADHTMKAYYMRKKLTTSRPGCFGREVSQRLCESFKANAYPTQEMLENLSKEIGITFHQVSIWFENTRRSFCLPETKEASKEENGTPNEDSISTKANLEEPRSGVKVVSANKKASKTENNTPSQDSIHTEMDVKEPGSETKVVSTNKEASKTEINTPNKDNIPPKTTVNEPQPEEKVVSATKEASETENSTPNKDSISATTNGKEPEPEVVVVADSSASIDVEEIRPFNLSTDHATPNRKGSRKVASTTPRWNSARYESRKRRQAMLEGRAAGEALTDNVKPTKRKETDLPGVQPDQTNGQCNKFESVHSQVETRRYSG
eukprot:TRINITY_DN6110_c0_g1_i1.p1 TRINITY_DN6110_c0_g1~~TRINITY_DN6110_c0_g1_i1.p1  ORF type:complete len:902 (+),score=213.23 TRINITY_DN6110_c0_g1_i1:447-3152(+)